MMWLPFWFGVSVAIAYRIGYARGSAQAWRKALDKLRMHFPETRL